MIEQFNLQDIENLVLNMEKKANLMIKATRPFVAIPVIGQRLYERALFEEVRARRFRDALEGAKNATSEEQKKLIEEFTPILLELQETKRPSEEKGRRR